MKGERGRSTRPLLCLRCVLEVCFEPWVCSRESRLGCCVRAPKGWHSCCAATWDRLKCMLCL